MPFKNKEKRQAASRKHYMNNTEKVRKGTKARYEAAKAFIRSRKTDEHCRTCNVQFPWYKLDFHHRTGTVKLYTIADMPSKNSSIVAIKKEMAKCDLTCSNCHREHTFNVTES